MLQYIGSKILLPIWSDPLCGDGQCEYPWEYPAWGRSATSHVAAVCCLLFVVYAALAGWAAWRTVLPAAWLALVCCASNLHIENAIAQVRLFAMAQTRQLSVQSRRFGCMADCGTNTNTTHLAVVVKGDFTGHPSISPRNLMVKASWNLCMNDRIRRSRGEADLCW